jgi:ankyrin repeat protein
LASLLQFQTSEPLDITVNVSFPLAMYAAKNWIIHANSSGKNNSQLSSVFVLMMKLLTDENTAFLNWVRLCDIDQYYHSNLQKERIEIAKPLYYASLAGLTEVSYALLEMGADINALGGKYRSALMAALCEDNEATANVLIEKGADLNAQEPFYGTVLQVASHKGHEAFAKLLIEKGADVNAQGGRYGNALQGASLNGHEAIAKLLIENGADVNAQGGFHGNALQAASFNGHEAIAKQLIEKGADVNAHGEDTMEMHFMQHYIMAMRQLQSC